MSARRWLLEATLLLGLGACASEADSAAIDDTSGSETHGWTEQPLVDLADLDAWVVIAAEDDPLADHRPATIDCPIGAWRSELGQLEVQTGVCSYLSLAQPSRVALAPDDWVRVDVWHEFLDAPAPATGHLAVLLGDTVIGEATIDIPHAAEVLRFEWQATRHVDAGTPVVLHLHNHGYNSWTFVSIDATTRD